MKYFITSDVHGFYTQLLAALNQKGFEIGNPEHKLIICGDIFDRGSEAVKLFEYLKTLKDQLILIRGNHEDLYSQCLSQLKKGLSPDHHHFSNKTVNTIEQLVLNQNVNYYTQLSEIRQLKGGIVKYNKLNQLYKPAIEVENWINSTAINYFETCNYIFVHGWIPEKINDDYQYEYIYNGFEGFGGMYNPQWRLTSNDDWADARWLNGMHQWKKGVIEPNKTIVCGHWHCSWGNSHYHLDEHLKEFPEKNQRGFEESFKPFVDNGIIALDACTAYSGIVNCIVVED